MTAQPRVLIADDEPHIRLYLKTLLTSLGCDVVAQAKDGAEAVVLHRMHRPDVTFLDINMPGIDGRDALEAIRRRFPEAIVVMLTSVAGAATVQACLDAGASNYLRKDLPAAELREELMRMLAPHAVPSQAPT